MSNFSVSFEPSIPGGGLLQPPVDPDWSEIWQAVQGEPEFDTTFTICGHDFGYYPADLTTVLGDILGELHHLDRGTDHLVSMSGYTILKAEISDGLVAFIDPGLHPAWRYEVPITEVRAALIAASKDLWSFINARKPALSA